MPKPRVLLILLLVFAVAGCTSPTLPSATDDHSPGAIQHVEPLDAYTATTLRLMLWWADLPEPVGISTGIRLYRVEYWTLDPQGEPTVASGLVALPKKGPLHAAVSYQHGTTSNRHLTPSKPTLHEGVLGSAIFAGAGYLFAAPDYIGLGTSSKPHPYLYAETTAITTLDLLVAAKTLVQSLGFTCPPDVYLVGFSQGGHATMAAHRALEVMPDPPFRVKASAGAAGPYNLAGITFPAALEGKSGGDSLYLAWSSLAYSIIYNQPLDSLLVSPYAKKAPALFDGEHEADAIMAALPAKPREMFTKEFLDAFDNKKPHWFLEALDQNEVFRWTPKAPVRLYYGDLDVDVPPQEAKAAEAEFQKRGADAKAISVGPYEHDVSILHAVPKVRLWFDEMTKDEEKR
jgi:pimeloyl-ACP methyl ester carboxylesterase